MVNFVPKRKEELEMKISILREAGYEEAMLGLSLSKGATIERAKEVAVTLADKDLGHNKCLEFIYVWLDVTAPRFWWQEADTYRLSSKQSESTMHTIHKRHLEQMDFEQDIYTGTLSDVNYLIDKYRETKNIKALLELKTTLPEGFLQRRIWVVNYKNLRNILLQRTTHRLPQWQKFCAYIRDYVEHPELLP
jgi:hypothetical protein